MVRKVKRLGLTEDTFVKNIMFGSYKNLDENLLNKINFEKVVKIISGHLIIPSFYIKCKKIGLLRKFPIDFTEYINEIYEINKKRNIKIKKEIFEIAYLFNQNKIKHVFIKGSKNLFENNLFDIGERMIGDIDILIFEKDYKKAISKIEEYGYKNTDVNKYLVKLDQYKHYPRLTKIGKLAAIEIHRELFNPKYKNIIDKNEIFKEYEELEDICFPSKKHQIINLVYNDQINDLNYVYLNFNYRTLHDFNVYFKKGVKFYEKYNCKIFKNFLNITDELEITSTKLKINLLKKIRLRIILNYKIFYKIDKFLCDKIYVPFFKMELKRLLIDKNYQKYLFYKLFYNN